MRFGFGLTKEGIASAYPYSSSMEYVSYFSWFQKNLKNNKIRKIKTLKISKICFFSILGLITETLKTPAFVHRYLEGGEVQAVLASD